MLRITFCAVPPERNFRTNDNRLEVQPPAGFTLLSEPEQMQVIYLMLEQQGYTHIGGVGWRYLEPFSLWGVAFTLDGQPHTEVVGWFTQKGVPVTVEDYEQATALQQRLRIGHPQVLKRVTCEWHT